MIFYKKEEDTPIDGAPAQKGFGKITALVGSYGRLFPFAEKQGNQCNNHRTECKQRHEKLEQIRICYIHDIALPSSERDEKKENGFTLSVIDWEELKPPTVFMMCPHL